MRVHEDGSGEVVISLEGVLDGFAARRVEAALMQAAPGSRIRVDVTQVRQFEDFGVAVLGDAVSRSPALVKLRGLRQHQIRVLRYFGIETARFERDATSDAA